MSKRHFCLFLFIAVLLAIMAWTPSNSQGSNQNIIVGRNVNMVAGQKLPLGDPWLQRQNEPSIAVSTRNPLHLLAGANDYRTVEMPILGEELPGLPEGVAAGDAWLGVFKSFNGGQTWMSTLLPGYPQDQSYEGTSSRLYGFQAAADPTVRAGPNGLFFYSGIAFDRVKNGRSAVFVARYIDSNNKEKGDSIDYIDTTVIDEGTSGQFADKPWIAVDIPRFGMGTRIVKGQSISNFNVYLVYSIFLGDLAQNVHNQILFARSTDCGNSWSKPIKLSEGQHINQGTTIAIDPRNGHIYVAWRGFASETESDSIVIVKSEDEGRTFSKSKEFSRIDFFDQGTTVTSFRTNAFPTLAVDHNGIAYLAWSQRGAGVPASEGDARIVLMTKTPQEKRWSKPKPIDNYAGRGHQIMPSLTFAAGKLMMAWYDFRNDVSGNFEYYIADPPESGLRHTVDIRVAEANPGKNPDFGTSTQVSRYIWIMEGMNCFQAQFNPPNYPLFKKGTVPFIGDYIDICPSPMFILENGGWRFNTEPLDPSVFHVTWTDNRDVRPPPTPLFDWTDYNPPFSEQPGFPPGSCSDGARTGMRNQNIYTSRLIPGPGIEVGSLGNTKPLWENKIRAFVICVKNTTDEDRCFRLLITNQPSGGHASFFPFTEPAGENDVVDTLDIWIARLSSISRPVFVTSSEPKASVRINVFEIDGLGGYPTGELNSFIVLNPDPTNPKIVNHDDWEHGDPDIELVESHNPSLTTLPSVNLVNVNLVNPNITDVNLVNPSLVIIDPTDVNLVNPTMMADVNLVNPTMIDSVNLVNVNLVNTSITDPQEVTDVQWKVKNEGNTTSSYTIRSVAPESLPTGLYAQLIIYRIHTTPATSGLEGLAGCPLKEEPNHEVLVNLVNPHIIDPNIEDVNLVNPDLGNVAIQNATFALAPAEEALVALRIIKTGPGEITAEDLRLAEKFKENVGAGATSHALNTGQTQYSVSSTPLKIFTLSLPNGVIDEPYESYIYNGKVYIKIFGGSGSYEWLIISGDLPCGLNLVDPDIDDYTREIQGIPELEESIPYPHTYTFILQVTDLESGESDTRELSILVLDNLEILTTSLPDGIVGEDYGPHTIKAEGGIGDYTWSLAGGISPGLKWDPDTATISGIPTTAGLYEFTVKVTDPGPPVQEATMPLSINILIPKPTVSGKVTFQELPLEGVLIDVEGLSGDPILTDEFGQYEVKVDYGWTGAVTPSMEGYLIYPPSRTYETPVIADQTGQDFVAFIEDWVERYNNDSVNGDDEATAIAVANEGVIVTGYSTGKTTGADYTTIKYSIYGDLGWDEKYDGPSHEGDYAKAVAVDSSGHACVTGFSYRGIPWKHSDYETVYYDSLGSEVWNVRYDSRRNGNDEATAIVFDRFGNFCVTGRSEESLGSGDKDYDYYTAKYNSSGKKLWDDRYDGPADGADEAAAIAVDSEGNIYVTGRSWGSETDFDYYTIKYATNKKDSWESRYNSPANGSDEATAIAVDASGNVYVTGKSYGGSKTGFDYTTIKYDKDGIQKWVATYNGPGDGNDEAIAIAVAESGNVYATGRSDGGSGTGFDYCTVKYDSSGTEEWAARYNNDPVDGDDEATALDIDLTGIFITGKSQGNGTNLDYATVKYDFSGNIVWLARYDGPANGDDLAVAIAVDSSRNVYVTGSSQGIETSKDYLTIKYIQ